ncbi:uncharacterized protein LOC111349530 [Spodoptera litura]|uniref:Uncharacterized protein LOC111349530 n=1 Tax=Spodoptera litura TaxID=69820 RepID=A0A9J7DVA7_SPOLT|nr:uncharacterized protein LOC111349530 [Spodoptera litura]
MLRAAVAALACLCMARASPAEHSLQALTTQNPKDIASILSSIEERLRVLDTVSAVQAKQARRLDIIQDKLERVENTLTLKLERAQLTAERLEHRLHMLQTNIQASIKESSEKLERSQAKIGEIARNLTNHIISHKHLLEKVNGAYADTWHRSLMLESLMRDGLSLVNVTRRELADGLRALARRQRDSRINTADLETIFTKRLSDNSYRIDLKMQELIDAQKRFVDSCQQVQQDGPKSVTDVLEKLIDSLIGVTSSTFHELKKIQNDINKYDSRVVKILNATRIPQTDATCRRLEGAFRNTSHTILKENELRQLTEKFVSLTDRADAALQRLEAHLKDDEPTSEVTAAADRLLEKLEGINNEESEEFDWEDDDTGYFDDGGGGDIMGIDKDILSGGASERMATTTTRPPHRRHLHKHPYDRGPNIN